MVPSDSDAPDIDLTTGSNAPQEPERTLERAIGTQIRDLRQRFHLSVGHLANAASISSGMLSKIENGQISASLSTLQALAQALNVPITNLFAAFEEKRDCSFVKAGRASPSNGAAARSAMSINCWAMRWAARW